MLLCDLPIELLLGIYCNLSSTADAIAFAQSCRHIGGLFRNGTTQKQILQSIVLHSKYGRSGVDHELGFLDKLWEEAVHKSEIYPSRFETVPIDSFLAQFDSIESECILDAVVIKSAKYQRGLLDASTALFSGERTLVARTLHFFILVCKIAETAPKPPSDEEGESDGLEQEEPDGLDDSERSQGEESGNGVISSLFKEILDETDSLITKGKPEHWPTIMTVLSLLLWTSSRLMEEDLGTEPVMDIAADISSATRPLCRAFYIAMKGNHPLSRSWKLDEFRGLVGGDTLRVDQFAVFNRAWCLSTSETHFDVDTLDDDDDYDDGDGGTYKYDIDEDLSMIDDHPCFQGFAGWMDRFEALCYGTDTVLEAYPPGHPYIVPWGLKGLRID